MISGHRRMNAAMINGQEKIQAIVRKLTDDQATIIMVDSKGAATKAYEALTKEVILNVEKEHKRHKSSYVR